MTNIDLHQHDCARAIWDYLRVDETPKAADAILALGRDDFQVAEKARELYDARHAPLIVLAGGVGRMSGSLGRPEALAFQAFLLDRGVPRADMLVEPNSRNTAENFSEAVKLLRTRLPSVSTLLVVTHSPHARRAIATARKVAPGIEFVPCPDACTLHPPSTPEYVVDVEEMIGEVHRLQHYPALGYFDSVDVPEHIARCCAFLSSST